MRNHITPQCHHGAYLSRFRLARWGIRTIQRHHSNSLSTFLTTHAWSFRLPDLRARNFDVTGATPYACIGRNTLFLASWILQFVNHRGQMTFVSLNLRNANDKEKSHQDPLKKWKRTYLVLFQNETSSSSMPLWLSYGLSKDPMRCDKLYCQESRLLKKTLTIYHESPT